ncbi:MAG TPA: hypothetical protein PLQ59_09835, partial [Fervidobacterium sp.]|nr:hypothetical protein [Fervidobacterium sp.]
GYLIKWNVELWYKGEDTPENTPKVQDGEQDSEMENEANEVEESFIPFGAQIVTLLLALTLVVIGFMPSLVHNQTMSIANNVLDFRPYLDLILRGGM